MFFITVELEAHIKTYIKLTFICNEFLIWMVKNFLFLHSSVLVKFANFNYKMCAIKSLHVEKRSVSINAGTELK